MTPLRNLGAALRLLRCRRNWTQAEAADKCGEGIGQPDISRWEAEEPARLRVASLNQLLEGYGATLGELAAALEQVQAEAEAKTPAEEDEEDAVDDFISSLDHPRTRARLVHIVEEVLDEREGARGRQARSKPKKAD